MQTILTILGFRVLPLGKFASIKIQNHKMQHENSETRLKSERIQTPIAFSKPREKSVGNTFLVGALIIWKG
jgi:hypothetical protein